jgi:hypothetical protein
VRNVEPRTRVCRGYAVVPLRGELDTRDAEDAGAAADSVGTPDTGRRAAGIARSGRAVLSGALYWTMAWRAAVRGARAANQSWSPR